MLDENNVSSIGKQSSYVDMLKSSWKKATKAAEMLIISWKWWENQLRGYKAAEMLTSSSLCEFTARIRLHDCCQLCHPSEKKTRK